MYSDCSVKFLFIPFLNVLYYQTKQIDKRQNGNFLFMHLCYCLFYFVLKWENDHNIHIHTSTSNKRIHTQSQMHSLLHKYKTIEKKINAFTAILYNFLIKILINFYAHFSCLLFFYVIYTHSHCYFPWIFLTL